MISDELFVCLILTAPLYAAFTGLLFSIPRPVITAVGLFWTGLSAWRLQYSGFPDKTIYFGRWLGGSVDESISILLNFRFDSLAALGIGSAGVCLLSAPLLTFFSTSGTPRTDRPRTDRPRTDRPRTSESLTQLLILFTLCGLACTATDLMVIAAVWMLIDILLTHRLSGTVQSTARIRLLGALRLAPLVLLSAGLAIQTRYNSVQIDEFLTASQSDSRVDASPVNSGFGVWIALAICCRAAFFPCVLWLKQFSEHARPLDMISVPVGILIPTGVFVMRAAPLIDNSSQAYLLLSVLGAMTAVITAGIAAVQIRNAPAFLALQVSAFAIGVVCLFLGSSAPHSPPPFLLVPPLTGLGAALLCRQTRSAAKLRRWPAISFLCVVAVCNPGAAIAISTAAPCTVNFLTTSCLQLGQLVFAIALVRLLYRSADVPDRTQPVLPPPAHNTGQPAVRASLFSALASGPYPALAVTVLFLTSIPQFSDHFLLSPAVFPGVIPIGIIAGCILFSRNSQLAKALKPAFAAIIRLSDRWWYLEPLSRWLCVIPYRIVSHFAGIVDRHLIGAAPEGAWMARFQKPGGHLEFYQQLDRRYAALAAAACLTGLLIALTRIGN